MDKAAILDWVDMEQGSASAHEIEALWEALPEDGELVYVYPNSELESCGLQAHRHYTFESAFEAIGCERKGQRDD